MAHPPLYRKKASGNCLKVIAGAAVLIFGAYFLYHNRPGFNPQRLVENSVLQARNFEADVKEIVSPKYGIKAYWFEDKTNPIVSMDFRFKNAGYASDNAGEQGIANLAAALLGSGAGEYDNTAINEELESRAIGISFQAGKDDFSGSLLTTRDHLAKATELLALMLSRPRFDKADIVRAKAQLQEALRRQNEHPANALQLEFNRELYGAHPYARNPLGKAQDIAAIDKAQLLKFTQDNLTRQNLIAGIAGDISEAEAEELLDKVFGSLKESGRINFVRAAEPDFDGRKKEISRDSGQNIVMKAAPGVARSDEDFYPLFIANYIAGGSGLSSRLSQEIREKRGLTYGVSSYLVPDDKSPLLMADFSTTPDNYTEAERIFAEEWQKMGDYGVSATELEQAKNYLTASYNLRFASIANIAEMLTAMQKYNLGLDFLQKRNDYVRQVTIEQVNAAAKKYFNKDRLVSMSIGSFKD